MLLLKEMKADIIKEMKKTEEAIKVEMKTNNEAIMNKVELAVSEVDELQARMALLVIPEEKDNIDQPEEEAPVTGDADDDEEKDVLPAGLLGQHH